MTGSVENLKKRKKNFILWIIFWKILTKVNIYNTTFGHIYFCVLWGAPYKEICYSDPLKKILKSKE